MCNLRMNNTYTENINMNCANIFKPHTHSALCSKCRFECEWFIVSIMNTNVRQWTVFFPFPWADNSANIDLDGDGYWLVPSI